MCALMDAAGLTLALALALHLTPDPNVRPLVMWITSSAGWWIIGRFVVWIWWGYAFGGMGLREVKALHMPPTRLPPYPHPIPH